MKWLAMIVSMAPALVAADIEPEFYVCGPYIQASLVGEPTKQGWPVVLRLTDAGARAFEGFTAANQGQVVRVVVGEQVFSRATVNSAMAGGRLRGVFGSEREARVWWQRLAAKVPEAPCGAPGSPEWRNGLQG
ncbi:MAG: hypothetical protein AWU57_364 [Marinobacter sp. T13-3]|nr:MAG: hypothetical protein AWU57_364 [Marinobacter sp. T13-3]